MSNLTVSNTCGSSDHQKKQLDLIVLDWISLFTYLSIRLVSTNPKCSRAALI